jgi:flagellar hook-associated protein 3 FlgL
MAVGNVGARSLLLTKSLVSMRSQLGDLQRQLATGKRADTYAGIGLDRGLTVGLRSHLAAMKSYGDTITNVDVRLELSQSVLSRISELGHEVKAASAPVNNAGPAIMQQLAEASLGEILGLLNTQSGDRYLFSGLAADTPSVETLDHILNGDGARAGLKQIVSERLQADQGASGLGRVVVSKPTLTSVQAAEEAPVTVFGLKLDAITTTLTGATLTPPAGVPPQTMSIDLGAINPNAGENVKFTFALPDGTTETITLTATASTTPAAAEFTIGASSDITATNLQNALTASLTKLADTRLAAASAVAASDDFFNIDAANPPQRVAGPPFNTATALVNGTAADTVTWYTGEAGATAARSTATAKVDQDIGVSYGQRANEEGIRWQLQQIAALAAIALPGGDPDTNARMAALNDRIRPNLDVPAGTQSIEAISAELAGAQTTLLAAKERHRQTNATLSDLLESVEGVSNEETAAKILAMQTTLQASLQTTAILYQTNILKYL